MKTRDSKPAAAGDGKKTFTILHTENSELMMLKEPLGSRGRRNFMLSLLITAFALTGIGMAQAQNRDRKSTRLNSSHT